MKLTTFASPSTTKNVTFKADSGASNHYIREKDAHILKNTHRNTNGPVVYLPDNTTLQTQYSGNIPLANVSQQGTNAHVLPNLHSASLLSMGQLCDDGCTVFLTQHNITIKKDNNIVLQGPRNRLDGLWDITLPSHPSKYTLNAIIRKDKTKFELIHYLHGVCWSPPVSTFRKAIKKGHFITWPGLSPHTTLLKHLTTTVATAKGHLDQERQNLQSTKIPYEELETDDDKFPMSPTPVKTYDCISSIQPFEAKEKGYLDLTGRFPHKSARGNQYILLVYDYDSNAILVEPLPNRQRATITRAWTTIHNILASKGAKPNLYIMDNEASKELKETMTQQRINFELVPPHTHRRNAAERAIRTFKNHFIAGLASVNPNFPVAQWDRLLPQAIITLNHLRAARANPHLSAHAYLFGNYNFQAHPMAPPGTKVLIHEKPQERGTWSTHGISAWYIGPSLQHYRCVNCFIPSTNATRDTDTVQYFPHDITFPEVTTEDYLKQAVDDIVQLLKNKPNIVPTLQYGDDTRNAIDAIATLLSRAAPRPPSPTTSSPPTATPTPTPTDTPTTPSVDTRNTTVPAPRVEPRSSTHAVPRVDPQPSPHAVPRVATQPTSIPDPQIPIPSTFPTTKSFPPTQPQREQTYTYKPNTRYSTHYQRKMHQYQHQPTFTFPYNNNIPQQYSRQQPTSYSQYRTFFPRLIPQLLAQHATKHYMNHIFTNGKKETLDSLLRGPNKTVWERGLANELGRLSQGMKDRVRAMDTIDFIHRHEVPSGKKVTYANMVCDYRPLKKEPYRVRLTVGGDRLPYAGDAGSPATTNAELKILLNSVISDAKHGARFISADLSDFFLESTMPSPEYMRIHSKYFPPEMHDLYDITSKIATDSYVYVKIKRGMYGLKQAAILAYEQLVKNLKPHGYYPVPNTSGLWAHKSRRTMFVLCVDDFGIKYYNDEDKQHLLDTLRKFYRVTVDDTGTNYLGYTIEWNYEQGYVDISMPLYIPRALKRFNHPHPKRPQYAPHKWTKPVYGSKVQYAPTDDTPLLGPNDTQLVQSINGTMLFYGRAVEPTILPACNEISTQQAKPTKTTMEACRMLLDYAATYPGAKIRYHASDMILYTSSDAAYLVLPNAKSRVAGHYYLSNRTTDHVSKTPPPLNGPILTECSRIKKTVGSAAEAETEGLYHNGQNVIPLRIILKALKHPQPPTPMETDNTIAHGFTHSNIKIRKAKAWDMKYHWLRDRETHKELDIYWREGKKNDSDYFTKHHPPDHHKKMRSRYILKSFLLTLARKATTP